MKEAITIFLFTVGTTLFYWFVAQQVPQKEAHPPKELVLRQDLTTSEMVIIGEQLFNGKGTCYTCHQPELSNRYPLLDQIGAEAGNRVEGQSGLDYLLESMYEPNAYVLEPYLAGMPVISNLLTDEEILAVIAYLQSQGGTPTVTMAHQSQYSGTNPYDFSGGADEGDGMKALNLDGPGIFSKFSCNTCHLVEKSDIVLAGPSLHDVGNRLSTPTIYESILDPEAQITAGYEGGTMSALLNGNGFYEQVTSKDLKILVDYLASLKGEN